MKSIVPLFVICSVLSGAATLGAAEAAPLLDLFSLEPARWSASEGMVITRKDSPARLVFESAGKESVWAAPPGRFPVEPGTTLKLAWSKGAGELIVQAEWFDAEGVFLQASPLVSGREGAQEKALAEAIPAGVKPAQFGLKFWLAGHSAKMEITQCVLSRAVEFKTKGVSLLHKYGAKTELESDAGVEIAKDTFPWKIQLKADIPYAAFVLKDRVKYRNGDVVLANVSSIKRGCGVSVQALCWNGEGVFLKEVDIMKDITGPGLYEIDLELYADSFPPETRELSFKIWLSGKDAQAEIGGLFYGRR